MEEGVIRLEPRNICILHSDCITCSCGCCSTTNNCCSLLWLEWWRLGNAPCAITVEEKRWVVEVILRICVGLYAEEIFGVTEMRCERCWRFLHVGEKFGERFAPRPSDGVCCVDNIERHISRVCIDNCFHAVARIVETVIQATTRCELIGICRLRIWVTAC